MEKTVGILGGGQLGRMLVESANLLTIKTTILDNEGAPALQISPGDHRICGSYKDGEMIRRLADSCDLITMEIEHVDTAALEAISDRIDIHPHWRTVRTIQDKFLQKEHLKKASIPVVESVEVRKNEPGATQAIADKLGYPFMLKSRTEAYDGRGNFPVRSGGDIKPALASLAERPLYAERWIDFRQELAVMVVKTESAASTDWENTTKAFPVVETVHENSICKLVYAPARDITASLTSEAEILARSAVASFEGKGVFGVEMFRTKEDTLLVNEIAPRPHNSGHFTIEACPVSQFSAHLQAILGLPVYEDNLEQIGPAIMLNILGGKDTSSHEEAFNVSSKVRGATVHRYGKGESRPGRKMGHVTVRAATMAEAEARIQPLVKMVDAIRAGVTPTVEIAGEPPLVAITMGSQSDREVLKPCTSLLSDLGISYSASITSAHRTPDRMVQFAKEARSRGSRVIIAAAGGAAHLPGMIASMTSLPVIGVPVKSKSLDGLDSLLSIVQMPAGCPVGTVGINNSANAAQLAARILGASDYRIQQSLDAFLERQRQTVEKTAHRMESLGFEGFEQT